MLARVTLKTGGSGAVSHYGVSNLSYAIKSVPVFSRMGVTLICPDKTVFLPYVNLMSLEWS